MELTLFSTEKFSRIQNYPVLNGSFLEQEYQSIENILNLEEEDFTIVPDRDKIFRAFEVTPYENLTAVILGQDPYPNFHADGVAFSAEFATASLDKIQEALHNFYGGFTLKSDMSIFIESGFLLLNSALTVRENSPDSHKMLWDKFMKSVIKSLDASRPDLYWFLWGSRASKLYKSINKNPDPKRVFESDHPAYAARKRQTYIINGMHIIHKLFSDHD